MAVGSFRHKVLLGQGPPQLLQDFIRLKMPSTSSTKAPKGFPGMAAKVAFCLSKPGVPQHRNLETYWHGSIRAKMPARKVVRAKSLLRIFLALQPGLLVSLHLVCQPESALSRGGGVLIPRLPRANMGARVEYIILYSLWHNHSTENPLMASDWLTGYVMQRLFPAL